MSRTEVQSTTASIEERANDPVYQKQLAGFEKDRQRIRKQRAVIEAKMARLRAYAKAKKGLPPGVTDEQIEGALDGAPLREWHELVAARKACMAEEEKNHAAARAVVAERISRKKAGIRAQGAVPEAK